MSDMTAPAATLPRRRSFLRTAAVFAVIISALASLTFLIPWIYIHVWAPTHWVQWNYRQGPIVIWWIADIDEFAYAMEYHPQGGIPRAIGNGITSTGWNGNEYECFWFRTHSSTQRHFDRAIEMAVPHDALKQFPGYDVTASWLVFYPGRIAFTLAIPALAWLAWLSFRLSRAIVRRILRTTPRGICPLCGYDLRATPDRCPECGWLTPPRVDADELADRLSQVR